MSLRALCLAALALVLSGCVRHPESCRVCGRDVHASVRTTLILSSGKQVLACCPRCAMHFQEDPSHAVREIRVTDHAAGGRFSMAGAFLVEGSDVTPCMQHHPVSDESRTPMQVCYDRCMPSLIAFENEGAARAFAADHGGTVHRPGTFVLPRSASP